MSHATIQLGAVQPGLNSVFAGKVKRNSTRDYQFQVNTSTIVGATLSGLSSNAELILLNANKVPLASFSNGRGNDSFLYTFVPGVYYARVQGLGKHQARYQIDITATALPAPRPAAPTASTNPSNPPVTNPEGGGGTTGGGGGGGSNPTAGWLGTYRGEATTRITQINPLNGQAVATDTYQQSMTMILGQPVTDGEGHYENNPFDLLVAPTYNAASLAGGNLNLDSATVVSTDLGPLLLRYWTLQVTANGFIGTLSDAHTAEAVALNSVIGYAYVIPLEPQYGTIPDSYTFLDASNGAQYQTTLTATFTSSNTLDIKVQGVGTASGSEAAISIDFVATRVS